MRLYTTLSKIFQKAGSIDICLKFLIKHGPSALNTGTAYLSSLSLSGKIPVIKDEVRAYCNGLQILRNNFDPVLDVIDHTFFFHFSDKCVVYTCYECSFIFIFKPACSILSERAQD